MGFVADDGSFTELLPLPAYRELTAYPRDGHVELMDSAGVLISADIGINGCLMPYMEGEGNFLLIDGAEYRGGILFKVGESNGLTVINHLTMDEYLYGVIHREMGMTNPLEALKAQSVAARTFAVVNRDRHASEGFDVCSTIHCQVYGGRKDEYESTCKAVDETSGRILRYRGEAAESYYHKNSGGYTQNSEDEWSTRAPHLRGVADTYSPVYPWQAVISFDTLRQKLILAQMDPGAVKSVRIESYDGSGAVSSLFIEGSDRQVDLSKSMIRAVLGSSLVRSRHFSLGDLYLGGTNQAGTIHLSILSGTGVKKMDGSAAISILSAVGKQSTAAIETLSFTNGRETAKLQPSAESPAPGGDDINKTVTGGTLTVTGVGYGHGVGMSQDGAIEMAKQGMDYEEILKFYFTDIEVY